MNDNDNETVEPNEMRNVTKRDQSESSIIPNLVLVIFKYSRESYDQKSICPTIIKPNEMTVVEFKYLKSRTTDRRRRLHKTAIKKADHHHRQGRFPPCLNRQTLPQERNIQRPRCLLASVWPGVEKCCRCRNIIRESGSYARNPVCRRL